jgi:hypothetical protein
MTDKALEPVERVKATLAQIADDMESAVAYNMRWISFSEAHGFAERIRAAIEAMRPETSND